MTIWAVTFSYKATFHNRDCQICQIWGSSSLNKYLKHERDISNANNVKGQAKKLGFLTA